jgi:hypothetical protein
MESSGRSAVHAHLDAQISSRGVRIATLLSVSVHTTIGLFRTSEAFVDARALRRP